MPRIKNIKDIVEFQLCCGCGVCAYLNPDRIVMVDTLEYGRKPVIKSEVSKDLYSKDDFLACPGIEVSRLKDPRISGISSKMYSAWGPILEIWEGFAADPEIRFMGSSGGGATALALYCMEKGKMHGVLHIAPRSDISYLNHTVLSTTRQELLAATGSRYAPASPCDGLQKVENAPGPCVFIGKPCDVVATQKARAIRPLLEENLGLVIALFCAGTPSTLGTIRMFEAMGVKRPSCVVSTRYRGNGWPGKASVQFSDNGTIRTCELTYEQSWGDILQKYRQWRCYICPDHTGEFSDIAVGDPWYLKASQHDPGRSLFLLRSERGRRIFQEAVREGYLSAQQVDFGVLPASQRGILQSRGALWGRLQVLKIFRVPTPRFRGMSIFPFWCSELTFKQKLQSFYGTLKRIVTKRLWQRHAMISFIHFSCFGIENRKSQVP